MSASGSAPRKRGSKEVEEEDTILILSAFVDFKNQHGTNPTPTTIVPLHAAVNPSLHHPLNADQLYNKFRSLKHKYFRAANAGGPTSDSTPFDLTFFALACKIWGLEEKKPKLQNGNGAAIENGVKNEEEVDDDEVKEEDVEEEEEEEGSDGGDDDNDNTDDEELDSIRETHRCFTHTMRGMWEEKGFSMADFKLALKHISKKDMKKMEKKWKRHYMEEMEIKGMRLKMQQEIVKEVVAGCKVKEED